MLKREIAEKLVTLAQGFPVVTVTGPRQSGKTTLVREVYPEYTYLNLENIDTMMAAKEDPRAFLSGYQDRGVIIDEAQKVPELFSYLQGIVDESGQMGRYILTGSQNFLLLEKITQSLAGRAGILHLLPFSEVELEAGGLGQHDLDTALFYGKYPPIFDRPVAPADFYLSYIETYIERDVRTMKNIGDLSLFRKFLLLCAGRTGQLLNTSALGNEVGVDQKTIRSWLSILEASFIIFLLRPYHRNWNKRVVKQPKLYFYDTGLLCSLLGLKETRDVSSHYMRGSIFEGMVITEYLKSQYNRGLRPAAYFWRDHSGHEVDLLLENGASLCALEIKSSSTLHTSFFDGLKWFARQTGLAASNCALVYGGDSRQSRTAGDVYPWRDLPWGNGGSNK